jgi:hypothetical protein
VSDAKQIRPSQVTMAGWMIIVGSVVVVLTVFDQLGSFQTVEMREAVQKFLGDAPGNGLGLSVDSALTLLKVLSMVAAGCATAAGVLGWHVLRRHRGARIALTVIAVPLFFTGMVAGGFFSSLVAASALMLWSRPARDWFDGVTRPRPVIVHPSGAREPGTLPEVGPVVGSDAASAVQPVVEPLPYAGFGAPVPVAAQVRTRPGQVLWACLLTWAFSTVTLAILVVTSVALATDGTGLIEEARKQNPDLNSAGLTDPMLLVGVVVFLVVLVVWAVFAMVVAWFVWKGREWARITLICSAALTAGLSLIAVLTTFVTFALLIASGAAMRMLLNRRSADWCRAPKPPQPL